MELADALEKNPQSLGIDPGTLRVVAQCLKHYATPGPNLKCAENLKDFCLQQNLVF
jgi:hypothetical protein